MNIHIKAYITEEDSYHRDIISYQTTLTHFVTSILGLELHSNLTIEYMDEEGDWIRVNNEDQWSHAINLHMSIKDRSPKSSELFRLRVRPRTQRSLSQQAIVLSLEKTRAYSESDHISPRFQSYPPPPPAPPLNSQTSAGSKRKEDKKPAAPPSPPPMTTTMFVCKDYDISNLVEKPTLATVPPPSPPTPPRFSLQEAITNARNNLKNRSDSKEGPKVQVVQDYFTPSGVPKGEFLKELSARIKTNKQKHMSTKEEFDMVKDVKRGLHEELLRKCRKLDATVKSTLQSSSPLLDELLRRQKQFSMRQVQKKEDLAEYEWVDTRDLSLLVSGEEGSSSWLYSILSKFNF